ncbi:MAG TPA: hypothetical protein VGF56_00865 [Rhizomicrobium sp.]|jgi:hypothetical protein
MKLALLTGAFLALGLAAAPAATPITEDPGILRLATCQDSWFDWQKTDPAKLQKFAAYFRNDFTHSDNDPFAIPKTAKSIGGLHITQVFPGSVGMGVGFSVTVDARFDAAKAMLEKTLGKKLGKCETGDGMHMCELKIAEKRTVTLMASDNPKDSTTLVGCYYFYEK